MAVTRSFALCTAAPCLLWSVRRVPRVSWVRGVARKEEVVHRFFFSGKQSSQTTTRHQRQDTDTRTGAASRTFLPTAGRETTVGKKLSSLRSAYAEQGGRAVFRRKQGDVDDRQCDHRDPSQRITPSVLYRTGVGGAAAYEWLGAACSCGQNKFRR